MQAKTTVLDQPGQIAIARLMTLKAAVRLEAIGMKHSSGKSMRKVACKELGLRVNTHADTVIGALAREIEKRLKANNPQGLRCPGCNFAEFMEPALERDHHTHYCSNCGVYSSPGGPK